MRRWFLASALLAALVSHAEAARPNIVVVLFDDLGWAEPRINWDRSPFRMPNIDRLAREGMRFTDAHSAAAVCTPTRYGLLTGRYPFRIGQFGVLTTYSKPIIPSSRLTLPALLKREGYATGCVGKWHLGVEWEGGKPGTETAVPVGTRLTNGPNQLGFDYFCGFTHARNIRTVIEDDRVVANLPPVENQPYLIEKAVGFVERSAKADRPFLFYLPLGTPHEPVVPAPGFQGKSGAKDVVRNNPDYGDWILQGDAMLGRILEALDRLGVANDTIVVATSDNGAEHRPYPPLREAKRSIHEGGHRVPFVVRWPGKVKPGSVNDDVICLNDLMATAADAAGAKLPPDASEDGVSLLKTWLGTAGEPARGSLVHQSVAGDLAIRKGPWKLIFKIDGSRELYDLANDRTEKRNRLDDHPGIAAEMTALLRRQIDDGRSTPGPKRTNEAKVNLGGTPGKARRKAD